MADYGHDVLGEKFFEKREPSSALIRTLLQQMAPGHKVGAVYGSGKKANRDRTPDLVRDGVVVAAFLHRRSFKCTSCTGSDLSHGWRAVLYAHEEAREAELGKYRVVFYRAGHLAPRTVPGAVLHGAMSYFYEAAHPANVANAMNAYARGNGAGMVSEVSKSQTRKKLSRQSTYAPFGGGSALERGQKLRTQSFSAAGRRYVATEFLLTGPRFGHGVQIAPSRSRLVRAASDVVASDAGSCVPPPLQTHAVAAASAPITVFGDPLPRHAEALKEVFGGAVVECKNTLLCVHGHHLVQGAHHVCRETGTRDREASAAAVLGTGAACVEPPPALGTETACGGAGGDIAVGAPASRAPTAAVAGSPASAHGPAIMEKWICEHCGAPCAITVRPAEICVCEHCGSKHTQDAHVQRLELPAGLILALEALADQNTKAGIETLAYLLTPDPRAAAVARVTHALVPQQKGDNFSCWPTDDEGNANWMCEHNITYSTQGLRVRGKRRLN